MYKYICRSISLIIMDHKILYITFLFFHSVSGNFQRCRPLSLDNGRVKYRSRERMAKFICNTKFQLLGNKNAACIKGVWNKNPPLCIANRCRVLQGSPPGVMMESSFGGALLSFTCLDPTWTLNGSNQIYCDGRQWSSVPPTCVSIEPLKKCSFEATHIPLCGWMQDQEDDFDWTLITGSTLTENTGPQYDHTLGNTSTGHYIYTETSSPRKPGETARLISPTFHDFTSTLCLDFYYHMMSSSQTTGVGRLEVSLKTKDQNISELKPTFYRQGNQGLNWIKGQVYIGQMNESFQIVISASRGSSYAGGIAIDDVHLYHCNNMINGDNISSEEDLPQDVAQHQSNDNSYGGNGSTPETPNLGGSSTRKQAVNRAQGTGIHTTKLKNTETYFTTGKHKSRKHPVKPIIAAISNFERRSDKQLLYGLQRDKSNKEQQHITTPALTKPSPYTLDLLNVQDNLSENKESDEGHDVALYVGIGLGLTVIFLASMALILRLDSKFVSSNSGKKNQEKLMTPSFNGNVGITFQGGDGVSSLAIEISEIKKELSSMKSCLLQRQSCSPHNTDNDFSCVLNRISFIDEEIDEIIGKKPVASSKQTNKVSIPVPSASRDQNFLSDTDDTIPIMDKNVLSTEPLETMVYPYPEIEIHGTENNQTPLAIAERINKAEKDSKSQEKQLSHHALSDKNYFDVTKLDPSSASKIEDEKKDIFGHRRHKLKDTSMSDIINKTFPTLSSDDSAMVKQVVQQQGVEMSITTGLVEEEISFEGTRL